MRKARKKRLTKAEKENIILKDQLCKLQSDHGNLEQRYTREKRERERLEETFDFLARKDREQCEQIENLRADIRRISNYADRYASDRTDLTVDRAFGRIEGMLKELVRKFDPVMQEQSVTVAMASGNGRGIA